jgi:hypothetical protein
MKNKEQLQKYCLDLPKTLHREYKIMAVRNGTSMEKLIIKAMIEYMTKEEEADN